MEPTALAQLAYMFAHRGRRADALRIGDGLFERWQRGTIVASRISIACARSWGFRRNDRAMCLPARRAARINPADAPKAE